MKYKKIMTFFAVAAPIEILIRTFQVLFMLDDKGFSLPRYRDMGYKMLVVAIFGALVSMGLGFITHRCPESMPKMKPMLMAATILLGVWTIADVFIFPLSATAPIWQIIILKFLAVLSGILWIVFAFNKYLPFKLPPLLFVIPLLFWVVRLINAFTTLNTLALTTGHVFLLVSYCAVLVFMLEFAKQINGIDKEYNFKKLLASGIGAISFCGIFSVPYLIATLLGKDIAKTEGFSAILTVFITGLFILAFTVSHFSNHNLKKRRRRRHRTKTLEISDRVDRFYTGD